MLMLFLRLGEVCWDGQLEPLVDERFSAGDAGPYPV